MTSTPEEVGVSRGSTAKMNNEDEENYADIKTPVLSQDSDLGYCLCALDDDVVEEEEAPAEVVVEPILLANPSRYALAERAIDYVQSRRIPELMNFLMAQLLAHTPEHPLLFMTKLLDDCMLFRSGIGTPPTLYDVRHVNQLVRSFDPGARGWLSAAQVRRARSTVGLPMCPCDECPQVEDQLPTGFVAKKLYDELVDQLRGLLCAGIQLSQQERETNMVDDISEKCIAK